MLRPLILAALLLAPAVALGQPAATSSLPPPSAAPSSPAPPTVSGDGAGAGRYGRTPATPEMRQARQAMMQACQADFAKFCADAQPGQGGGRMQCLRQHGPEMSDGCRTALRAMRASRPDAGAPAAAAAPSSSPSPSPSPQG